jgi:hypothetical protein
MDETNGSVCVKGVNYVVIYYKAENIHLLLSQQEERVLYCVLSTSFLLFYFSLMSTISFRLSGDDMTALVASVGIN